MHTYSKSSHMCVLKSTYLRKYLCNTLLLLLNQVVLHLSCDFYLFLIYLLTLEKKLSLEVKTPSLINELYEKRCKKFIFSIDLLRQAMKKRGNSFLKLNFTALANEMKQPGKVCKKSIRTLPKTNYRNSIINMQ